MSVQTRIVTALAAAISLVASSCSATEEEDTAPPASEVTLEPQAAAPTTEMIGEPRTSNETIQVGDKSRNYWISAPPAALNGEEVPLIFVFHGLNEYASTIRDYSHFDKANAIVVYPNGFEQAWAPAPYAKTSGEEDIAFVDAIRKDVESRYTVDPARVFAAGLSNGGGFAAYLGCQRPQQFTAIATVSAAYYWRVSDGCSQIPMKHIDIHGTADGVIEYDGGVRHETEYTSVPEMLSEASRRNHCSGEVILSQFGPTAVKSTYQDCDAPLEHIRVGTGGHVWPGHPSDNSGLDSDMATNEILNFWGVAYRGS
ncbi:alpha/beta hydrolase family esterase [Corynebacterium sp. S7]